MLQAKYSGLTSREAKTKLQEFGENSLSKSKKRNYLKELLEEVRNPMTLILILASGISYWAGEEIDAAIIFGIVILNITLSFFQKFKADKAVEKLQSLVNPHTKVFRENKLISIQSKYLVPGDIIKLSEGDLIPADCEIIEAKQFYVQESTLTGESVPLNKQTKAKLFMGTESVQGQAICMVTETGSNTEFGQIADLTAKTQKDLSPLQKEIISLSHKIAFAMLLIAIVFFSISLYQNGTENIYQTIIFTASIAVAAIPEGLPTTITLSLSLGVQRLAKKGSIIKNLSSVETLGSTDILVTDKTGTLTKNEMTVTKIITEDTNIKVSGSGYDPKGEIKFPNNIDINQNTNLNLLKQSPEINDLLFKQSLISLYCNDSIVEEKDNTYHVIGDPTEGSLITLSNKTPYNQNSLDNYKILDTIPFNSQDKFMATLVQDTNSKAKYILLKGAPEVVMEKTTLDSKQQKNLQNKTNKLADQALRTLCLCIKETRAKSLSDKLLDDLEFVSIVGIIDPPRIETKSALREAKELGLQTIMATGDHPLTAKAIGETLGFSTKHVYKGSQLEEMTDEELSQVIQTEENIIFARVKPKHKLRIVNISKSLDKIVAVTGDGVNDAPALKRADIGIAMGVAGTEVSKEAADMILTEDNFNDIILAIKEGRVIYQNIRKFLFYLFSCNFGEVFCILLSFIFGFPLPITAILILAINLGTDIFPALSLSFEQEKISGIKEDRAQGIINKQTFFRICLQGLTLGTIAFTLFYYVYSQTQNYTLATTACFLCLVITQMGNVFNAKSLKRTIFNRSIFSNIYLNLSILVSAFLAFLIVLNPTLNQLFKTQPLKTEYIMICLAGTILIIFTDETRKFFLRSSAQNAN